jgi:hypothetical protein
MVKRKRTDPYFEMEFVFCLTTPFNTTLSMQIKVDLQN